MTDAPEPAPQPPPPPDPRPAAPPPVEPVMHPGFPNNERERAKLAVRSRRGQVHRLLASHVSYDRVQAIISKEFDVPIAVVAGDIVHLMRRWSLVMKRSGTVQGFIAQWFQTQSEAIRRGMVLASNADAAVAVNGLKMALAGQALMAQALGLRAASAKLPGGPVTVDDDRRGLDPRSTLLDLIKAADDAGELLKDADVVGGGTGASAPDFDLGAAGGAAGNGTNGNGTH